MGTRKKVDFFSVCLFVWVFFPPRKQVAKLKSRGCVLLNLSVTCVTRGRISVSWKEKVVDGCLCSEKVLAKRKMMHVLALQKREIITVNHLIFPFFPPQTVT